MACNRIHLSKFLLVYITVSPRLSLGLCKFAATNTEQLISLIIFLVLLVALLLQSCFDPSCFFTHALHDLIGFFAKVGLWAMKAEFESRRRHMVW